MMPTKIVTSVLGGQDPYIPLLFTGTPQFCKAQWSIKAAKVWSSDHFSMQDIFPYKSRWIPQEPTSIMKRDTCRSSVCKGCAGWWLTLRSLKMRILLPSKSPGIPKHQSWTTKTRGTPGSGMFVTTFVKAKSGRRADSLCTGAFHRSNAKLEMWRKNSCKIQILRLEFRWSWQVWVDAGVISTPLDM